MPDDKDVIAASYDRLAEEYTRRIAGELAHKPFDRALLDGLAERLRGAGPVADVGCGPGHVADYLHARGVEALGFDLSPAMVRQARELFPHVPFHVADVTRLEASDAAWAGAVAFYSLIHLPPEELVVALRELHRVLRPGAPLVVAFHAGTEVRHLDALWDVPVSLDFRFFLPERMEADLRAAGFEIERRDEREPYPDVEAPTRRCYITARRAAR
jgi:SAM-dependent methyltransferase